MCLHLVSPKSNEISPASVVSIEEGRTQIFNCTTDSSHPNSQMHWEKDRQNVTNSSTSSQTNGMLGGNKVQSSYNYVAASKDNGVAVSCVPVWNGNEIGGLKRMVSLDVLCEYKSQIGFKIPVTM